MLELRAIRYAAGGVPILHGVSATFPPGALSMIIGPNGSGKSTLLKIASHELEPASGEVLYGGKSILRDDRAALARRRAALSQNISIAFPLTVEEVVMMGRYPHFAMKPSSADRDICELAMRRIDVERFRARNYLTLSGGEQQMVQFARVMAQIWERPASGDRYLLLDEPTTFLDVNHQHRLLELLRSIAADDVVVVMVVHDVNLAAQYADRIAALRAGECIVSGSPAEVMTPELFSDLYGMRGTIVRGDDLDFPIVVFR